MFADPQSVTINAVATSFARNPSRDPSAGVFRTSDGQGTLTIANQFRPTRQRFTIRLDNKKIDSDPLDGTGMLKQPYSMSTYLVIDAPATGYSATQIGHQVQALVDWLDVAGNITKVLGGEA